MNITLLIILVLFIVIIIIFAIFKDKTPIMENMTNYDSETIFNTSIPTIVFFHSSKCGVCESMIPEYEMLRKTYENNPKYRIAIINCDNNNMCSTSGVNKFPTIRHYTNPSKKEYKTIFEGNN